MGAAVRVAVDVATALNVFPEGEATDVEGVEQVLDALGVGLVEGDEDAFHFVDGIDGINGICGNYGINGSCGNYGFGVRYSCCL